MRQLSTTVLVTGANGQIGSVLVKALREKYGQSQVIATDIRDSGAHDEGIFQPLDVLDARALAAAVERWQVTEVYHLAAILSAKGEQNPRQAWEINMNGLFNILEVARQYQLKAFFPSSIAVFGEHIQRISTPQFAVLAPTTVYGISKAAGENWCQYYFHKYGVDVRSIRYPGIIGYQSLPGGGTTDYAVDIFHVALRNEPFTCFLAEDARLPMMYMEDAIRATLELMEAPAERLSIRTSYNLAAMSFSPAEIAAEIQKHLPDFSIRYEPDFRQQIAEGWPQSIDDSQARVDWGWQPAFDLARMTEDMLLHLKVR
jgi:threonine 3-dehydrogenase